MKRTLTAFVLYAGILLPVLRPPDIFGGVPLPATEITQLANYLQLFKSLFTQISQLQAAFTQIQWAVYNTKNISQHPFTTIMGDLQTLGNVIQTSQGLAYTLGGLDKQFAAQYPNYDPHQQWFQNYANWSANTMKTLNGTLGSVGFQGANLMNEQQTLGQLRMMASTPMGQNQAAQLGVNATLEVGSQLVKLRQLFITDMQQKSAYMGGQMQQEATKQQVPVTAFPGTQWQADQRGW